MLRTRTQSHGFLVTGSEAPGGEAAIVIALEHPREVERSSSSSGKFGGFLGGICQGPSTSCLIPWHSRSEMPHHTWRPEAFVSWSQELVPWELSL